MDSRLNYIIAGAFVALIFLTIIFVTAILPATTFQPEVSAAAHKYTAKEYRGREIYKREGCFYCHSQFVRYQDREAGEMVAAGDYAYETPHLLGTERTGPDLSNIGGKYPDAWHMAHHKSPRAVKPGSIMPSFSYLTDEEMSDLVAYLQTVGSQRKQPAWIVPPQEIRDHFAIISQKVDVNSSAAANAGRGIFMQNCAQCHGTQGKGNGIVSITMMKKPANFTRAYYSAYSDEMWFWRISEGVPGTRMPRWGRTLGDEDMLYLVAFLKTLQANPNTPNGQLETTNFSQVESPKALSTNYYQIDLLNTGATQGHYVYGGGR